MLKKILFFAVTIIIGIVVAIAAYFTITYNHLYDVIDDAIAAGEYDTINRVFTVFFDDKPVVSKGLATADYKFLMYESTSSFERVVDQTTESYFANSYSILLVDITNLQFNDIKISDEETKNDSGIVLKNGDLIYEYKFVNETEDFNLVKNYENNNIIQVNIERVIIEEVLNGQITYVRLNNSNGETIFELDCNLDFESDFFNRTKELVDKYDECIINEDAEGFNNFYDEWVIEYKNLGYRLGFTKKELMPTSVYIKIVGVVVIYIAIMGVLGYFILRRKRG